MNPQTDTPESAEAMTDAPTLSKTSQETFLYVMEHNAGNDLRGELLREAARRLREQSDTALKLQRCEEALIMAEMALCLVPAKGMGNYFMGELQSSHITPALAKVRAALTHPTRNEGEKKV